MTALRASTPRQSCARQQYATARARRQYICCSIGLKQRFTQTKSIAATLQQITGCAKSAYSIPAAGPWPLHHRHRQTITLADSIHRYKICGYVCHRSHQRHPSLSSAGQCQRGNAQRRYQHQSSQPDGSRYRQLTDSHRNTDQHNQHAGNYQAHTAAQWYGNINEPSCISKKNQRAKT